MEWQQAFGSVGLVSSKVILKVLELVIELVFLKG